ncbi:unnamed protein product [Spirodela intermedia]|uniref:Uncharacterized protein n=1 Tax=Spirodela intermedia TaxID=51605 RepID=A0ABN7E9X1_SPIIN|nr:unnamed protein product [Spirodela intermedia]
MEVGHVLGSLSSGPRSKRRLFIASSPLPDDGLFSLSRVCMTTPCPTAGWQLVTWKGSGAHVPLSVLDAQALLVALSDCTSDPLAVFLGRRVPPFYIFYFNFLIFIYLKSKTVKII